MENLTNFEKKTTQITLDSKSFCFVLPRYWTGIAGGAETLCGQIAENLVKEGARVTIATTCAKDNRTWEDHFPARISVENGIEICRFPVSPRNLEIWIPLQIRISENIPLNIDEQLNWMKESVNSDQLYQYLSLNRDSFDLFFFAPYLFGTTFWGSQINPDKSFLIPCLHDEEYAYLNITKEMFRSIKGCLFNCNPEMELANKLYGEISGGVVGMGFDPNLYLADDFKEPYFKEKFPYLVYIGRKETGKNVHLLIDYFIELKDQSGKNSEVNINNLKLVIAGGGDFSDLHRPQARERDDIIDIGHVSEDDKKRLIVHAHALCQPSTNESFSIVIMESWLLDTPVLVHANCAVTRQHVIDSGGGLYFADYNDFEGVVKKLLREEEFRQGLILGGHEYVNANYSWPEILKKFKIGIESK